MDNKMRAAKYGMQIPDLPKRLNIGLLDGYCNLKCPMCYVHGNGKEGETVIRGKMSYDNACRIFDEVMTTTPVINPILWAEPLMVQGLAEYIKAMKSRNINVVINTNGLLLTEELAQFFTEIRLDSIFFSIDAMKKETLKKIRGTEDIDKIKSAVFRMLEARGEGNSPRIGVSFVENSINAPEKEDFLNYWLRHVDAVRVNEEYTLLESNSEEMAGIKRIPCGILFDTMIIFHNGDVPICCLDSTNKYKVGNVFEKGVRDIWLGERFEEFRNYHLNNEADKIPLCRRCKVWMSGVIEEIIAGDVLIRKSPLLTFYNRIDRLDGLEPLKR